jgi:ectoine hydroxylase-related dioxygenase (phytanoyl-CoA dioxygenase family)
MRPLASRHEAIGLMSTIDPGYSIAERVFNRREMTRACEALATAGLARTKAGARHVLQVPEVLGLATSPALMSLAATFIGPQPIPFRATLFDKSAVSNWLVAWHQDTALPLSRRVEDSSWGPWSVKRGVVHAIAPAAVLATTVALRVHLDDSTHANGPLRVLPGTHVRGVLTRDEITQLAGVVAPVECVSPAGGVVAMRPLVVHASSKARDAQPRRVLHIEYAATVHLGSDIELAVG